MRYIASAIEIKNLDERTIASGISGKDLMQRAGSGCYQKIKELFPKYLTKPLILCGKGNNGGDARVIAELMFADGISPNIIDTENFQETSILDATLIIDGLLGIGQKGELRGNIQKILKLVSKSPVKKIAIDVPTGINIDTGEVLSEYAFSADYTLCIELLKKGMLQDPARSLCGQIEIISIGLLEPFNCKLELAAPDSNFKFDRKYSAHKGSFGHVLVIGGEYAGAGDMAAYAAIKTGAGIVSKSGSSTHYPEIILIDQDKIFDLFTKAKVLLIGSGLGQSQEAEDVLREVLKQKLPKVVDADALNLIAAKKIQADFSGSVFTPHPKEAARLLGISTSEVQRDRYQAAEALQKKYQATIVLKGAGTVIASEKKQFVNITGNPFMATAGSGDVLAGIIAGLIVQGYSLESAARYGTALHGIAGNLAVKCSGSTITATEIISQISKALPELSNTELFKDFLNFSRNFS